MIRLENLLKASLQDVLKMPWRRFCKMSWRCLKTSWQDVLARRLEEVLKISWKRLEDVLKTHDQEEYIGLNQDALKVCSEYLWLRWIYSSLSTRLGDILKTSSEEEDEKRLQDVFTRSSLGRIFASMIFFSFNVIIL